MRAHNLKIALRTLRRDRAYALLNGAGLALALACCLLVGMFVRAERQVDTFHPHADRLRAVSVTDVLDAAEPGLSTPMPLAAALERHTAVDRAVVTSSAGVDAVRVPGQEGIHRVRVQTVSDGYFDLFGFRLVHGDRARVLSEPGIVLSERVALRLFGDPAPLGQTLTLERYQDTLNVAVTGIVADSSGRSRLDAEALLSVASLPEDNRGGWQMSGSATFLRLAPGRTDADLAPAFAAVAAEHYAERDVPPAYGVVPLGALHLSEISPADGFRGDAGSLRFFSTVAGFVLLLGAINYVNLATARAARRAREVGVRKAVGAGRGQVAALFLVEAVVLAGLAGVASLALALVLRPGFNALFGADLGPGDVDAPFVLAALGLALATGLVAGVYPALVLSSVQPVSALRGTTGSGRPAAARLRQALVVVQITVAVGLLAGTGVVVRQIAYAQTEDPGYDADNLVVLDLVSARLTPRWEAALSAVRALPQVEAAVATQNYPTNAEGFYADDIDGRAVSFRTVEGEPDYLRTIGARVVAGRLLDGRASDRTGAVVFNEEAVRELGWGPPAKAVGREFTFNGAAWTVVGVVADQHLATFREPIDPMRVIVPEPWEGQSLSYPALLVRLRPGGLATGVDGIRAALAGLGAESEADVQFLDERVAGLYASERRLGGVLAAFAGVAVLIACLGLFGLASYTAERRTKEIGVRRVLGASVRQVVLLLTREYVVLVAVAALVAVPASVWAMSRWLDGFAYRTRLDPGLFAGAVAVAFVFAVGAVGGQALRAARRDPARSLRSE